MISNSTQPEKYARLIEAAQGTAPGVTEPEHSENIATGMLIANEAVAIAYRQMDAALDLVPMEYHGGTWWVQLLDVRGLIHDQIKLAPRDGDQPAPTYKVPSSSEKLGLLEDQLSRHPELMKLILAQVVAKLPPDILRSKSDDDEGLQDAPKIPTGAESGSPSYSGGFTWVQTTPSSETSGSKSDAIGDAGEKE